MSCYSTGTTSGPWLTLDEYERLAVMDDRDIITEADVQEFPGPWVQCELGHRGCIIAEHTSNMVRDQGGWICVNCDLTQKAEWEAERGYSW